MLRSQAFVSGGRLHVESRPHHTSFDAPGNAVRNVRHSVIGDPTPIHEVRRGNGGIYFIPPSTLVQHGFSSLYGTEVSESVHPSKIDDFCNSKRFYPRSHNGDLFGIGETDVVGNRHDNVFKRQTERRHIDTFYFANLIMKILLFLMNFVVIVQSTFVMILDKQMSYIVMVENMD